ncbi:MAG: hypothetical protein ACRD0R_19755 [Acidimicrobiales bacterium]
MTDTPGPWGPYRATIDDHLDTCADYLGRLRRSLAGEIAPDRHYFADKAHQLHTAARRMVRIVQDIDCWLGECAATVEHAGADGTRLTADCTLPAGHRRDTTLVALADATIEVAAPVMADMVQWVEVPPGDPADVHAPQHHHVPRHARDATGGPRRRRTQWVSRSAAGAGTARTPRR